MENWGIKFKSFAIKCPKNYLDNDLWISYLKFLTLRDDNVFFDKKSFDGWYYGVNKFGLVSCEYSHESFDVIHPFEYITELLKKEMNSIERIIKDSYYKCEGNNIIVRALDSYNPGVERFNGVVVFSTNTQFHIGYTSEKFIVNMFEYSSSYEVFEKCFEHKLKIFDKDIDSKENI